MGYEGAHTFPKCISLEENVIALLEFELASNDVAVQHVNYYFPCVNINFQMFLVFF